MFGVILQIYRFIFCRKVFYTLNFHLQRLTLRGIGVMNAEGSDMTGEKKLLQLLQAKGNLQSIVDVGANTGGYSSELRALFPHAEIYAIEPHPKTFAIMKERTKGKKLYLYNAGLGQEKGKGVLYDFADDAELKATQPTSTLASTIKEVITSLHHQKAQSYTFPLLTLDAFAKQEGIKTIDLLKIDTEGNELQVLQGAKELLKQDRIRFIQFEFNEMNAYAGTFFKDFITLLPGFTFYRLMPYGLYPLGPYRPSTHEVFAFQNILAVSKGESIAV